MVDQAALLRTFHGYARVLLGPYELGTVLYQLTDQVVDLLGVDGAGVSLTHDDERLTFVTATDANITAVEETQLANGHGPCHEAFRTGSVVAVDDLADETRWDEYRAFAIEHGIRAVAGIPMPVGDQRIGALNLYRHTAGPWSQEDLDAAQLLADMASGYILNATQLDESRTLTTQLQHALDSRIVVEQAKGVIAERHDITVHQAFEILRAEARGTGTRVHAVCTRVVEGELDLSPGAASGAPRDT